MLESGSLNKPQSSNIKLIDFGFSKPLLKRGIHIEKEQGLPFSGNLLFASHNALKRVSQSRRDDLISLAYLLVYLLNGPPEWAKDRVCSEQKFAKIAKIKKNMTPADLCQGPAYKILPYVTEVFNYKFKEMPNYSKLKFTLAKVLFEYNLHPSLKFDWSLIPKHLMYVKLSYQSQKEMRVDMENVQGCAEEQR